MDSPTSFIPQLNFSTWAGLAAAGAIIATCWRTIATWLRYVCDLAICRVVVKDEAARAVMSRVWSRGQRSPFGLRLFSGIQGFVSPKKRIEVIAYEGLTSEPRLFWFGGVPMILSVGRSHKDNSDTDIGGYNDQSPPVTIRYLRGTIDFDDMLEQAVIEYNRLRQSRKEGDTANKRRRFNVIRMYGPSRNESEMVKRSSGGDTPISPKAEPNHILTQLQQGEFRTLTWKPEELIEQSSDTPPFVNHPIAPEILSQFDEISDWIKYENWFRSKSIPWRRGYLLASAPGAGKDTLIRNLAMKHDLPVYAFDLSSYDNQSFANDYKTVMQNAPAIALVSDIDGVFHGRTNVVTQGKNREGLTFDCLLNTISGIGASDGVLLFITTNHIEHIDEALGVAKDGSVKSSRPGRIDKVIHLGNMGEPQRRALAQVIVGDWPECIDDIVKAGEGETAAQFQERCAQFALKRFWEVGATVEPQLIERNGFSILEKEVNEVCAAKVIADVRYNELKQRIHS